MLRACTRPLWLLQSQAGACQPALLSQRLFSAATPEPAKPESSSEASTDAIGNEKVRKLAQEVMELTVLECSWLTEILRKKLNMQKPAFGGFGGMQMMAGPVAAAAAPAAAAEEKKPEPVKEKTEFSIKLESFSADGKIKVIKEIRALTSLGLKEAKELVGGGVCG